MAAELIGRCRCPVCNSDKARLSLAKSQLCVVTCNGCNFQGFARSDRSDELIRARMVADAPPAADPVRTTAPTPAPVRTAEPAAAPVRTAPPAPVAPPRAPTPAPTPTPAPPAQPAGPRWGIGLFGA